jgi:hypothetical protein
LAAADDPKDPQLDKLLEPGSKPSATFDDLLSEADRPKRSLDDLLGAAGDDPEPPERA